MTKPASIAEELGQRRPFPSLAQEVGVGLLRTSDLIRRRLAEVVEPRGITGQQYNVLRILRGSDPEPLPVLEIASRMVEEAPGITRLLDRLVDKGLVRRRRCEADRRQVHCRITPAGLALLGELDAEVDAALDSGLGELGATRLRRLGGLLDRVRDAVRRRASA
jgi:DNA-binding MarR family transcriptional regulator